MPHHKEKYYKELSNEDELHIKIWKFCIIERTYEQISKYVNLSIRQTKEQVSRMAKKEMVELTITPGKPTIIKRLNLVK